MNKATIQNVMDLMNREAILERHLADTRRDIADACQDIAIHTPGIKTAPDAYIDVVDVYVSRDMVVTVEPPRPDLPDIRLIVEHPL